MKIHQMPEPQNKVFFFYVMALEKNIIFGHNTKNNDFLL